MKKLLTATTALALVGGAAFAEINISGDAELGVDYNSEPGEAKSKFSFAHEVGIDFSGSGTTDGGLSFGGSAGFDTNDDTVNEGTVFISGAFGTVTFGDNDSADLVAGGIADVGLNGVGVDDVVESLRGGTADQMRYDNSFGQISIAFSAGTKDGTAAKDAVPATEWKIVGAQNNVGVFTTDNPTDDQYNNLFFERTAFGTSGLVITDATTITVNPFATLDDGTAIDAINIAGMGPNRRIDADDPESDIAGQADAATAATPQELAALEAYMAAYDLGDDRLVGGEDGDADKRLEGVVVPTNGEDSMPGTSADTQYGFGMSFNASGVTVGLGYDSEKTVSMGMGFSTGDIGTNLLYVKQDDGSTGLGADLSYAMGASTLTLAFAQGEHEVEGMEDDVKRNAMGLHLKHDLGGGASMVAGFAQVDDAKGDATNKASMGVSFKF